MERNKWMLFLGVLWMSLSLSSQEKRIEDVRIVGAKKTKSSFLKSLLITQKQAVLDSVALDQDILVLKRLPAISHAYYLVVGVSKSRCKVQIHVEENRTLIPSINFWTATNQQFSYKFGISEYNLWGRNIALSGFYQNNGFDSYGISLNAPTLFSKKSGLAINFKDRKSEEPLYFDFGSANYLYNNTSQEFLAIYQHTLHHQFNVGFSLFNEQYQYLSGNINPNVPKTLDVNKGLLKLVYVYDALEYHYQYIEGFKSVLYAQYVTTANAYQNNFMIAWNDLMYFKRISAKGNWANRLRVGLSSNDNTPFAPFALDNNVNLRGVGILVDRGTGSIVFNSEYRHTLLDTQSFALQSNVFADAGAWRNPGGTFNNFIQKDNIRVYSGVGLRFISKKVYNSIFRIDYGFKIFDGKNMSNGGLVFGVGQYF